MPLSYRRCVGNGQTAFDATMSTAEAIELLLCEELERKTILRSLREASC